MTVDVGIGTVSISRKMAPSSRETLGAVDRLMIRGRRGAARGQEKAGDHEEAPAAGRSRFGCHD